MGWNQVADAIVHGPLLDLATEPRRLDNILDQRAVFRGDGSIVEIGRRAAVHRGTVLGQEDELHTLGDYAGLTTARLPSVADTMFEIDEQPWLEAVVGIVHEDCALGQQRLEAFEDHIDQRIEKGMAGCDEFGLWRAGEMRLVEGDAGVAIEDRIGAADQPVSLLQDAGHSQDLESTLLARGHPAAKKGEGLAKEGPDEMRLEPARLRALHLLADFGDGRGVHALGRQLPLGHEALDALDIDGAFNPFEQFGLLGRRVAISDRLDQQVAKGMPFEQLTEHVIDLAAERLPRLFQLLKEAAIDLALACVGSAEVPKVANLCLADAMDAAEPLFQAVGVPREVVIHHQVRAALQVHAFAGGVIGDEHAHLWIGIECGDGRTARFAGDAAVNDSNGRRITDTGSNLGLEILQRIFRLREDKDLTARACGRIEHQRLVEHGFELAPFGILTRQFQRQGLSLKIAKRC